MKGTTPSLTSTSSKIIHVKTQKYPHYKNTYCFMYHIIMYLTNNSIFLELKPDKTINIHKNALQQILWLFIKILLFLSPQINISVILSHNIHILKLFLFLICKNLICIQKTFCIKGQSRASLNAETNYQSNVPFTYLPAHPPIKAELQVTNKGSHTLYIIKRITTHLSLIT